MQPVRINKVPWYHTTDWTGRMGAPAPRQIKKAVPWKQTRSGQPLRSKCTTRGSTRGCHRQKETATAQNSVDSRSFQRIWKDYLAD